MEKIEFKDYPNLTAPLNSSNLNKLQENVESAISNTDNNVSNIQTEIDSAQSDITNMRTDVNDLLTRVSNIENYEGIAEYVDGYINADTTEDPFILTQIGTPNQSLYFVITLFFSFRISTANRTQIAIPYNYSTSLKNTVYLRYYFNGAWTTWRLVNS